jgi:Tol biopolymer transport system component
LTGQSSSPTNGEIKRLIYHLQRGGAEENPFIGLPHGTTTWGSDIYVQDGLKTDAKRLVQGGEEPAWSPDGEKIAFLGFYRVHTEQEWNDIDGRATRELGGTSLITRQIRVMNADGSGAKQITNVSNGVWDFAWSPIENTIAYCELGPEGKTAIVVINADGSERHEVTKMGEIRCAVGLPILRVTLDRSKTLTSSRTEGGKVAIRLVGPHELAGAEENITGELVGDPTLSWSPDGERIAFTSAINGRPVVGVVGRNGGNAKPVVSGYAAQWSPDGKQLLFRHDSEGKMAVTSIWIANADGTQPRKIVENENAESGLTWFPDGKSIAFGSERETKNQIEIFRVKVDGTGLEKIASQAKTSLSSPVVSPDGTKLIVDAAPSTWNRYDASIWVVDLTSHRQEMEVVPPLVET